MIKESKGRTFAVAALLCVVCAVIVSVSDIALKGLQQQNKALDRQVNILRAAGVVPLDKKIGAEEARKRFENVQILVVDLTTGQTVRDVDPETTLKDKNNVVVIPKDEDVAGVKTIPKLALIYLFKDDSGTLRNVVLPIQGTGLWSTMRGFISLDEKLENIGHIVFYEHAETPGLGGEISNPNWTKKWENKKAFDQSGTPIIRVVKGVASPDPSKAESQVDGISGATLTGDGVTRTVQFWLGDRGYGRFLKNLRDGAVELSDDSKSNEDRTEEESNDTE